MHPTILNVLDKGWPFAASMLASAVAFGSLHSDVSTLKAEQASIRVDHDSVVTLTQGQKDMKQDLQDIKQALQRLEDRK